MLVWKVMRSMTPMMSPISRLLSVMPCMVLTTLPTTLPPRAATADAPWASWLACCALSALCRTVVQRCHPRRRGGRGEQAAMRGMPCLLRIVNVAGPPGRPSWGSSPA